MTISPFTIYLIAQANALLTASKFSIVGVITFLVIRSIVLAIISDSITDKAELAKVKQCYYQHVKIALGFLAFTTFLTIITPSSKTLAAMYIIPAVVNNVQIQEIGANSLDGLLQLSNEWAKSQVRLGSER